MADDKHAEKAGPAGPGKIDLDALRQLLALMGEHDLSELEIEQGDLVVRLRKGGPASAPMPAAATPIPAAVPAPAARAEPQEELPTIKSPMVGTFYAASSPDAAPFVKVGDRVTEETVVCIIEAMKVFNEIRAEMSGTIERVLARNAQAVEFGQPMFVVRPE